MPIWTYHIVPSSGCWPVIGAGNADRFKLDGWPALADHIMTGWRVGGLRSSNSSFGANPQIEKAAPEGAAFQTLCSEF